MEIVHFSLFRIFGNITALFLFLAPIITFKRIIRNKGTEKFSGVPYAMTLLNCLLPYAMKFYGLPFVPPNDLLVSINGTGAATEFIYVVIFLIYAPKRERGIILVIFSLVFSVFSIAALVSLLVDLDSKTKKVFCRFSASILSIIMYASPLSIIKTVTETKSVEFMPFFLSLFVFLCGTSWFVFGLLRRDPFVAVPNGFGYGLGVAQLILYFIYRENRGTSTAKPTDMESVKTQLPKENKDQSQSNVSEAQVDHLARALRHLDTWRR
ncbi:bidirectional sugar transporter SWEET1-like [Carya illinoinensis]|uniref:Bidirectional sugar transporter SWEET n=1 Tax=Carya illinoinensis TaxID=32201 RepID=A0A8T1QTX0_CARIL|nr:bidirectional sugar transporter SWEET1-like [Carya illinoinensis]KAG6657967.1 hypothetical protein CIPAW_04G126800 [Carya illinoinensis]